MRATNGAVGWVYVTRGRSDRQFQWRTIEAVFSAEDQPLDSEFKQVWVVDPESMRASLRHVTVGRLTNDKIAITQGLEEGEIIVAAGVNAVTEGMWLRPMQREPGL